MIKVLGVILTVALIAGSVAGTAGSGWILGEALHPARAGTIIGPFTLAMLLATLAVVIEAVRLVVAIFGERLWRRSRFQGVAFGAPLWLGCTAYCTLMPLLALILVPLLPAGSHMLTVIAPAWAAVQIAAGLLPGIHWLGSDRQPAQQAASAEATAAPRALPARAAIASASRPVSFAAKQQPVTVQDDALPTVHAAAPADLGIDSTTSADDFFRFLSRLSELPAGSTLPRRGRIGTNHEIMISQAGLAALVGRSKPTVRRWLQELERGSRIVKRPRGKDTCILLMQHAPTFNGGAHLNGAANGTA